MDHPLAWMLEHRTLWLVLLWTLSAVLVVALSVQGKDLRTEQAPWGILSLEFAWTGEYAAEMIDSWSGPLREPARDQIWLDVPFLLVYPLAFSLSCLALSRALEAPMATLGLALAWTVLVAGPLDLAENLAMLRMLGSGATDDLARLASWTATLKFALVGVTFAYLVVQGIATAFRSLGNS